MTLCVRQAESGVRKSCTRVVDGDVDRRSCEKQAGARREGSRGRAQRSSGCFLHGVRCRVGALVAIWPCPWTFLLSVSTRAGEAGTMARWDMLAAVYACIQLSLSCHPVHTFSSHTPLASHAAGLLMLPDMTTPTRSHNTKTSRIPAHDPRRWSPSAR
jgi:hypothetical protein